VTPSAEGKLPTAPVSEYQIMTNALTSYLNNHAEKEAHLHRMTKPRVYQSVLVVPAFQESVDCLTRLLTSPRHATLLILVANSPPSKNFETQEFVSEFRHQYATVWTNQHLSLHNYARLQDILLVDRCRDGNTIPRKQGVGLARKVGADIATNLIHQGVVESPWIHSTDADVRLPAGYFYHSTTSASDISARIYPFKHRAEPSIALASRLYEASLYYYVEGLRWSGSPYAYQTIGSTMAIHYSKYAAVRGFPKRSAGEDFYLLNKLAKVGEIECLNEPTLDIEARLSDRTPFGTGRALHKIRQLRHPIDEFLYYNPMVFVLLKDWLSVIPEIWRQRNHIDLDFLSKNAAANRQILKSCLLASGVLPVIRRGASQYKSRPAFNRYIKHWFDAFRTLKFIHYLRDNHFPSVPLKEIMSAPFINSINAEPRNDMLDLAAQTRSFQPAE
jgi:hypothetical protein